MWILRIFFAFCLLTIAPLVPPVAAENMLHPAVIYQGAPEDGAFNGTIHQGVKRYRTVTGGECLELSTPRDDAIYGIMVRRAAREGYNPILVPYGNHFRELPLVAEEFPATRFIAFDVEYDIPNLYCFTFNEHEGTFLAGAIAAMASHTGKIGFISGTNVPITQRFLCGYKQGARYINPQITVLDSFIGDGTKAWSDQETAIKLAKKQLDAGADVIFQAAGYSGLGVMREVAKAGKLSIGVDRNQNALYPGSVLTSMLKRLDRATFSALMIARRGVWRDNIKRLGLSQNALELAFDEHNLDIATPEMRKKIEEITGDILLGNILVHDYLHGSYCPIW